MAKKAPALRQSVQVRVPATTANLGPGFDTMGVALRLYNMVSLHRDDAAPELVGMIAETAAQFFFRAGRPPFRFRAEVSGDVPPARGLGSSVTVRLGVAAGLNFLAGEPLAPDSLLGLVIELEGHPDNAVPAFHGGFATSAPWRYFRTEVGARLKFVGLIPDFELETKKARAVLPASIPIADAIANLQYASLISAAFAQHDYPKLAGLFEDRWHQPFRAPLIPCWEGVRQAALGAGALGFYLSGAGSTLMALTLKDADKIAAKMEEASKIAGVGARSFVTTADNRGMKLSRR